MLLAAARATARKRKAVMDPFDKDKKKFHNACDVEVMEWVGRRA